MSSNHGDMVLDPFCGCGTAIDAAQGLGRQWIGIDITFIAVDLIEKRLHDRYPGIEAATRHSGYPATWTGARALFRRSPFDFERWAVTQINARPNAKQRGDKGVDGVARFYLDKKTNGRVLVSVKGGSQHRAAVRPRPARHCGDAESADGRPDHDGKSDSRRARCSEPWRQLHVARKRPDVPADAGDHHRGPASR